MGIFRILLSRGIYEWVLVPSKESFSLEKLNRFSILQRVLVLQYVVFFGFGDFLGLGVGSRDMTFIIPDLKMTGVVHWAEELLHLDRGLSRDVWVCRSKTMGPVVLPRDHIGPTDSYD